MRRHHIPKLSRSWSMKVAFFFSSSDTEGWLWTWLTDLFSGNHYSGFAARWKLNSNQWRMLSFFSLVHTLVFCKCPKKSWSYLGSVTNFLTKITMTDLRFQLWREQVPRGLCWAGLGRWERPGGRPEATPRKWSWAWSWSWSWRGCCQPWRQAPPPPEWCLNSDDGIPVR